jgi:hypothetical protein
MLLYQRRKLTTSEDIGGPAPLPVELEGLSNASLADLSAAIPDAVSELGYAGDGFFLTALPYPPPPPFYVVNKVDFLRLFTQAERINIRAAAAVNPVVDDYQNMLDAATTVNLQDPDILTGVPLLEQAGLIGPGRAAQILANEPPV